MSVSNITKPLAKSPLVDHSTERSFPLCFGVISVRLDSRKRSR
jgi:hypothetical protein